MKAREHTNKKALKINPDTGKKDPTHTHNQYAKPKTKGAKRIKCKKATDNLNIHHTKKAPNIRGYRGRKLKYK